MSEELERRKDEIRYWRGKRREKPQAIPVPGPGQESVWDYPRPPRVEKVDAVLTVVFNGRVVAKTERGLRVVERSIPPNYYFPPEDVDIGLLRKRPESDRTLCEWKGLADYYDVVVDGRVAESAAWAYFEATDEFQKIRGFLSFYPQLVDCYIGDTKVESQEGDYYGGWVTKDVLGPFKGGPGTENW